MARIERIYRRVKEEIIKIGNLKPYAIVPYFLQKGVWLITRPLLTFFLNLKIIGNENLNINDEKIIFASNHISELDPILIPTSFNFFSRYFPLFFVSRSKGMYDKVFLKEVFYGGFFFKILGAIPATMGIRDYKKSLFRHIQIINNGNSLVIFPEGGIPEYGKIVQPKGGVSYLSINLNIRIIPIKIWYSNKVNFKNFILGKIRANIFFGKPFIPLVINQSNNEFEIYKEYSKKVMKEINNLC